MSSSELHLHALCVFFPRIVGAEFDALVNDIKANGLRESIILYEGQVLDGGNRYRACLEAGVEPHFKGYEGGDVAKFVLSANMHRRHLSQGQNAAIIAQVNNWSQSRDADKGVATLPLATLADRAKASGTSPRTQRTADTVAKNDPDLIRQVAQGETTLAKAAVKVGAVKPRTKAEQEHEEAADAAFGDIDPVRELENAQAEIAALTVKLDAAFADDPKAEVLKQMQLKRVAEVARDSQVEALTREKAAHERTMRQLRRCGKAVGEQDLDNIAPTVEALARKYLVKAA